MKHYIAKGLAAYDGGCSLPKHSTFFREHIFQPNTHTHARTESIMCPVKKTQHLETLRDASFLWVDRYLFRDTDVFKVDEVKIHLLSKCILL